MVWWAVLFRTLSGLPLGVQVGFWLIVALIILPTVVVLIGMVLLKVRRRSFIEFYANREELNEGLYSLKREIERARKEVWVAWFVAPHATNQEIFLSPKISRVILLNYQDNPNLGLLHKMFPIYSEHGFQEEIKSALAQIDDRPAGHDKPQTFLVNEPLLNVVICDPKSNKKHGRARMEIFLPGISHTRRPSIVVYERENPALFGSVLEAFDWLSKQAVSRVSNNSQSTSDKAGSQP